MSKKRRREPRTVDMELVEIYEDLANENESIRLKAAHLLLSKFDSNNDASQEQLDTALKRLFRGLCSGRKAARLGFSVALTELLVQHVHDSPPKDLSLSLDLSQVLRSLKDLTHTTGNVSGQEERDHQYGRLFGVEALVKSGKLFNESSSSNYWGEVLEIILELAKKKSWLREECGWVLFNSIEKLRTTNGGENFARALIDRVDASDLARTPEGVAILIGCQQSFPELKMPKTVFPHGDPLHRKDKKVLSQVMRESSDITLADRKSDADVQAHKTPQKGSWLPKLHFAWDIVFNSLLEPNKKHCSFPEFWKIAVDEGLFSVASSMQRKSWGFSLFQRYVTNCPPDILPELFQPNFCRTLVNQLGAEDRFLHDMASKSLKALLNRALIGSSSAIPIVKALIDIDPAFDRLSKTKTIEKLLAGADMDTLEAAVPCLLDSVSKLSGHRDLPQYQAIVDILVNTVRTKEYPKREDPTFDRYREVVNKILIKFVQHGFATPDERDDKLRELFKSRISSCLTHTIAKDVTDPCFHPYSVLMAIREIPQAVPDAEESVLNTLKRGWKTLGRINSKETSESGKRRGVLSALKLLYVFTFLQLYQGDVDAVGILDELRDCYTLLAKIQPHNEVETGGEILVEVLLSFLSKPYLLYRRLASEVLPMCAEVINERGIESMLRILETEESSTGQGNLFDKESENGDVEMVDEDASDVEVATVDEDSEGDSTSSSIQESSDLSHDEINEADEELDAKLAEILGTRRADDDLAAQESESTDADMNDDEMEALDNKLSEFFKHQLGTKNKKQEQKQAKENIINFKVKVLEMLQILVKKDPTRHELLIIVCPLLRLLNTTSTKLVSSKAYELVKTFLKLYKYSFTKHSGDSTVLESGRSLLEQIHSLAGKPGSNIYWSACSQASLLAVKVVLNNGGSIEEVLTRYAATQTVLWEDSASVTRPSFFTEFQNWFFQARNEHIKVARK